MSGAASDNALTVMSLLQDLDNLITNFKTSEATYRAKIMARQYADAKTAQDDMVQFASSITLLVQDIKPMLATSYPKTTTYVNLSNLNDVDLAASVDAVAREYAKVLAKLDAEVPTRDDEPEYGSTAQQIARKKQRKAARLNYSYAGKDEVSELSMRSSLYRYALYLGIVVFMVLVVVMTDVNNVNALVFLLIIATIILIYEYGAAVTNRVNVATANWADKMYLKAQWLIQAV